MHVKFCHPDAKVQAWSLDRICDIFGSRYTYGSLAGLLRKYDKQSQIVQCIKHKNVLFRSGENFIEHIIMRHGPIKLCDG